MKKVKAGKYSSILLSIVAYVIAIIAAIQIVRLFNSDNLLVIIGIGDLVATIVIFVFSMIFNNSSMYDPYWSVKPAVILIYYMVLFQGNLTTFHYIVGFLMILYAIRLTMNFYRGWPGLSHEDWRYADFRKKFPKSYWLVSFLGIHFFPTVMVYLGCLPMLFIFENSFNQNHLLFFVGVGVTALSVVVAYLADEEKREFMKNSKNHGLSLKSGIWKFSRHPNYLGEILTWWGLFIIALSFSFGAWWTIAGAVVITIMFLVISIPMIERRMLVRRSDYVEYIKATPVLIPFLKKKQS